MRNRSNHKWYVAVVSFVLLWKQCVSFSTVHPSVIKPQQVKHEFSSNVGLRRSPHLTKMNILSEGASSLSIMTSLAVPRTFGTLTSTLLASTSTVPFYLAFALNSLLFFTLRKKLLSSMLTPEGLVHSLALGTMLWSTLGWKGWTLCVLYLFLGSLVTKVKMSEKQKLGIAEGRGGRRGPENVWYVALFQIIYIFIYVYIYYALPLMNCNTFYSHCNYILIYTSLCTVPVCECMYVCE